MSIKKMVTAAAALFALALVPAAYAADNGTEFGIEDDITVIGSEGTALDPDAEIKGFTVFGATQAAYTGAVVGAGNVVVNGYLAVSSGAYFVGGSTFASGGAYFTGVSSFSNVANVHFGGGAANQVLKKVAGGGMVWADDALGAGEIAGTPRRLVMFQADGTGGSDSLLQQDASDTSITMVSGSSMTILGAFQSNGAAKLNGAVDLGDNAGDAITAVGAVTAQNGVTVSGGGLSVTGGNASVTNDLTVNGNTTLGNAASDWIVAKSSTTVDINGGAVDNTAALAVKGSDTSGQYVSKFYSGASLAAWIKKK